jgi:hypothetical protein
VSTDAHADAMYEHAVQALAAAILASHSGPGSAYGHQVDTHVHALAEGGALPAAIAAWVNAMTGPSPDGVHGLAAYDPRTGQQVDPDGRAPADILAALRIITALRNSDFATGDALWEAARTAGHGVATAMVVLHLAARRIHVTPEGAT